jgi:hypothetical protein
MKGVNTVEFDYTVLEKVKLHFGVLVAVSAEIHGKDVVVDLD